MSAIIDDGAVEQIKVLIALHEGFDTLDAVGPMEVFSWAFHDKRDRSSKAFHVTFAAAGEKTISSQGAALGAHISFEEAMGRLSEFDVLVIPGGGTDPILKTKSQPVPLIKAYAELQKKYPNRERTLFSVCTGSLILGDAGILSGLTATTHPDFITKMEIICSNAATRDMTDRCDVAEDRYIVNNLRFELGENESENPYIMTRKELKEKQRRKSSAGGLPPTLEDGTNGAATANGRRPSNARKGSMSFKASNNRRESVLKRSQLRLGGLRVITASGITSGIDAALYLVGALVSEESADEVARVMCHEWRKGTVVDGIDV